MVDFLMGCIQNPKHEHACSLWSKRTSTQPTADSVSSESLFVWSQVQLSDAVRQTFCGPWALQLQSVNMPTMLASLDFTCVLVVLPQPFACWPASISFTLHCCKSPGSVTSRLHTKIHSLPCSIRLHPRSFCTQMGTWRLKVCNCCQ